ncbi:MAG: hypothetical protein Q8R50_14595 [Sediminibacterium sp.]|nr:hypothetical protein [Sediminibacterium sp.]
MKSFLIIAASFVLLSSSCRKNKPVNPIDQLPPETQTGANTFGCLVDGEVFKPGGAQLSGGSLQCNYQFFNNSYFFVLIGRNQTGGNLLTSVGIYTDSLRIFEGNNLNLKLRGKGNPSGDYFKSISAYQYELYSTNNILNTGELWIKKLDTVNQIASGTFWFDAVNANGQKVQIREGRFDVRYTR